MTALELPVVFGKNFSIGNDNKLFVEAGPYVAYSLWGSSKVEKEGVSNTRHDIFGKDGYKRFDYGLTLGLGVDLSNKIRVKCNYEFGIPNMMKNDAKFEGTTLSTYRNGTIATTLTYTF
ncbi:porin family protein [Prevotella sp. OH937_COT-195]|uniref:porin family protein n=1 Tax=Prevotella sp. OH937_COT-195 TaxID=2491051 RepID=UPI000F6457CC|nr:porin family protein [Prevotella sp. OH937_COT-195]RRD00968.1 PorT family protein [Prevotella sp. OH937_COT-195]